MEIIAWFADGPDDAEEEPYRQWRGHARGLRRDRAPGGDPKPLAGDGDPVPRRVKLRSNARRVIRAKRRYDPAPSPSRGHPTAGRL